MKQCPDYEPLIEGLLADEIDADDLDRLLDHAGSCAGCRSFVDLHYQLQDPELVSDLPADREFDLARQAVLTRIRAERAPRGESFGAGLRRFFDGLAFRPAWAAAVAALLVAAVGLGYVAGRGSGEQLLPLGPGDLVADPLVRQIGVEARGNHGLEDVEDSPFEYSNVSFRRLGDERVAMSFDVTRHVELARDRDDPLVRELLAQSMVNSSPVGTRLNAMSYAGALMDTKIEEALIFAMLNDSNQAVRIKALSILASQPANPRVQSAFISILGQEESVQLRLEALDYLATSGVSSERFDALLENLQANDDRALLVRAASYQQ